VQVHVEVQSRTEPLDHYQKAGMGQLDGFQPEERLGLAPQEAEVHGLVALMEIQASRLGARTDGNGEPVLLLDQDRSRWDWLLVGRGLAALERAERVRQPHSRNCNFLLEYAPRTRIFL